MDNLPAVPQYHPPQVAALSHSGSHITVAPSFESTITLIYPQSQRSSQLVCAGVEIEGLFITGSVLLVLGSYKVVAFLLTEDGLLGDAVDGRRTNYDPVWEISVSSMKGELGVEGTFGEIRLDEETLLRYHTATGEILPPEMNIPTFRRHVRIFQLSSGTCSRDPFQPEDDDPTGPDRYFSWPLLRGGWVDDPKGGHRLWLDVGLRLWRPDDWHPESATRFSFIGEDRSRPLIIKFSLEAFRPPL